LETRFCQTVVMFSSNKADTKQRYEVAEKAQQFKNGT